jgi:hypothetical protein
MSFVLVRSVTLEWKTSNTLRVQPFPVPILRKAEAIESVDSSTQMAVPGMVLLLLLLLLQEEITEAQARSRVCTQTTVQIRLCNRWVLLVLVLQTG